jgi:hypothetical protein
MENRADHRSSAVPWAPAAAYPRWISLQKHLSGHPDVSVPDARTVAHARTSKGRLISLSFVLAAPPAQSLRRPHSPGLPDGLDISSHPIAAHRDSVLIEIEIGKAYSSWRYNYNDDEFSSDYFIYSAGDAAADPSRPPSLSLLPPCYLTEQENGGPKKKRYMHDAGIALMRRAQDEVLVAALDFCEDKREEPVEAELCLLRSGG